jgi:Protein of unknown function (DUF3108)
VSRWLAVAALILVSAGSASPQQQKRTAATAPATLAEMGWERGETLVYNLTWLRIVGGSATFNIAPVAGDASRLRMNSVAQSNALFFFKVRDEIDSVVDRDTFSTLFYRKKLNERGRIKQEETAVDPARRVAVRKEKEIAVPTPVFDPLSLIYHLRTLDLTPGRTHHFSVIADGKVYVVETLVAERETVSTEGGTFHCVRVEPKLRAGGIFRDDDDNRLQVWYTDDERHIPIRIRTDVKVGTITASLKSAQVGTAMIIQGKGKD